MKPVHRLRTLILFLALVACAGTAVAQSPQAGDDITVPEVVGSGRNFDEAKTNAYRSAVETGLGLAIQSESKVENFQLTRQIILARAQGYVKRVGQTGDPVTKDGLVEVRLRDVVVGRALLLSDLDGFRQVAARMGQPRLMVVLSADSKASPELWTAAYGGAVKSLADKGFDVIDKTTSDAFTTEKVDLLGTSLQRAAMYGLRHNSDYVFVLDPQELDVTSAADTLPVNPAVLKIRKFRVQAQVINTTTAGILGNEEPPAVKTRDDFAPEVRNMTGGAVDQLVLRAVAHWGDWLLNGEKFVLALEGAGDDYEHLMSFQDAVEKIEYITGVEKRQSGGNLAEFDVRYKGRVGQLEREVYKAMKAVGWSMKLERQEGSRMIWRKTAAAAASRKP